MRFVLKCKFNKIIDDHANKDRNDDKYDERSKKRFFQHMPTTFLDFQGNFTAMIGKTENS